MKIALGLFALCILLPVAICAAQALPPETMATIAGIVIGYAIAGSLGLAAWWMMRQPTPQAQPTPPPAPQYQASPPQVIVVVQSAPYSLPQPSWSVQRRTPYFPTTQPAILLQSGETYDLPYDDDREEY